MRKYLTDAELGRFMSTLKGTRDRALFALLANTGIRPSEARALTRADCHLETGEPWIRIVRLKKKKSVPEFDDLPVPDTIASVLAEHLASLPPDGVTPVFSINPRSMQRTFHRYCREGGVRRIKLYSLRHTAATRLYSATRDIGLVQSVLGHEKPDMTALYTHIPQRILSDLAATFPVAV